VSSFKNYEIIHNLKYQNDNFEIQTIEKDKFVSSRTRIDEIQASFNENGNENSDGISSKSTLLSSDIDRELEGKPKVKLRELNQEDISNNQDSDNLYKQDVNITDGQEPEPIERGVETTYNALSFNYYWPLDPEHNLNVEGFKTQEKKQKNDSDIFRRNHSIVYKQVHSTYKESSIDISSRKKTKWKKTHLDFINVTKFRSQSLQEYSESIEKREVFPTMYSSQFVKRVLTAPVLSSYSSLQPGVKPVVTVDEDGFTTVGAKKLEKRYDDIYQLHSTSLLPKKLPEEKINDFPTAVPITSYTIPLTIKITKSKQIH
jgi:hypothetical protein